jgi:transposase-like protein
VYLKIAGRMVYLWRAVDAEGEVLDVLVQSKRDKPAALKLMRKLLKKYGFVPDRMITDDLRSYGAAARDLVAMMLERRDFKGCWRKTLPIFVSGAAHALQASFERQTAHSSPAPSGYKLAGI